MSAMVVCPACRARPQSQAASGRTRCRSHRRVGAIRAPARPVRGPEELAATAALGPGGRSSLGRPDATARHPDPARWAAPPARPPWSDTPSMTTIACPRCDTTFETQATTATRCRECRSVVHLGQRSVPGGTPVPSWSRTRSPGLEDEPGEGTVVVVVLAAAGVVLAVYLFVRAWRRRRAAERHHDDGSPTGGVIRPSGPPPWASSR